VREDEETSMFEGINWLAVLASGFAFFALGAIWYSVFFGKRWAALVGLDYENPGGNTGLIFGLALALELLASAVLAVMIRDTGFSGWQGGLHVALMIGLGVVTPVVAINYLFQRKSPALIGIDAGYMVLGLAVAGVILGVWR
jgi:hypothetical protein